MEAILTPTDYPPCRPFDLLALGHSDDDLDQIDTVTNWTDCSYAVSQGAADNQPPVQTLFAPLLNRVGQLSELFADAFSGLLPGGHFVCRLEEISQRKRRILGRLPAGIGWLQYVGDYGLHRLSPRLPLTRTLYRRFFPALRALSKAEALGRLYHAGFMVTALIPTDTDLMIVARKVETEYRPLPPADEGIMLRLWRVGQGGDLFCVYKLRTMHPYSEYAQEYIMQTNGLAAGGKVNDDFRVSTLGHWMRRYWIDELPMLVNLLKGDMKLVGVRPISVHYFGLYPAEARQERIRYKPGLVPPYYADLPTNFAEIVSSEQRYLRAYDQAPLLTDLRYLLKIGYNIFWKRARSQ